MPEDDHPIEDILRETRDRLQRSERDLQDADDILSSTQDRIFSTYSCLRDSQLLIEQLQLLGFADPKA
jgi:hypothetical protein